jgi:LemA protein
MTKMEFFIVILALIIIYIFIYNGLITLRNQVDESWAQIDVQIKRRFDLIPNLIETVKGYAQHEQATLTKVIEARNQAMQNQAGDKQALINADNMLTQSLKSLFALKEDYPELKANESFLALQHELATTENKVAYSRQLYNSTVMRYNTKIESVPGNIIAGIHKFHKRDMLTIPDEEKVVPKVQF